MSAASNGGRILCRLFGHADDTRYQRKPIRMNPKHPGRRLLQRDDIVYTCRRCGRVKVV